MTCNDGGEMHRGNGTTIQGPPNRSCSGHGWMVAIMMLALCAAAPAETWRGLTVAPEHRCTEYDKRRDYPYPRSIEDDIVRALGGVYGPYTGTCFSSPRETDIEHLVATSEAHDSGLCAADAATRRAFAQDPQNLTLASPTVNRHQKSGKDAGEWLPARNACWFAARVVAVKRAYGLTVDRREAQALEAVLSGCESVALEPLVCQTTTAATAASSPTTGAGGDDALSRYDDNRNGRITCKEARAHGIAPGVTRAPGIRLHE